MTSDLDWAKAALRSLLVRVCLRIADESAATAEAMRAVAAARQKLK